MVDFGGASDMALDDDALKNMTAMVQIPESAGLLLIAILPLRTPESPFR